MLKVAVRVTGGQRMLGFGASIASGIVSERVSMEAFLRSRFEWVLHTVSLS
jgi:hypothetical protein